MFHKTWRRLSCITAAIAIFGLGASCAQGANRIGFWDHPQYGGNSFNEAVPDEAYFRALKATGATWVRLTFSKWKGEKRDFLIGNADHYDGIPKSDLATLIRCLDAAQAAGIKVVIVPLSLPGDRWSQQNGNVQDDRLWKNKAYWDQSAAFWTDLATALKDHPAVIGYNLVNEPTPEKGLGLDEQADAATRMAWYAKYKGTSHDLPDFYAQLIAAIRKVDPDTPLMVDGGWYANAGSFAYWPSKLSDDKVLYSFHMYEPYEATSAPNVKRNPQLRYPGTKGWVEGDEVVWSKAVMQIYLSIPFKWAKTHGVPANRMVAGELGCVRQWVDCGNYLNDVLDTLNARKTHWAFYGFREDGWDAMDYELAPSVTQGQFYYLREQGKAEQLKRTPHPLLDVIEAHMKGETRKSMGIARINNQGEITVYLQDEQGDFIGKAIFLPGNPDHEKILKEIDGLEPGELKSVPLNN